MGKDTIDKSIDKRDVKKSRQRQLKRKKYTNTEKMAVVDIEIMLDGQGQVRI